MTSLGVVAVTQTDCDVFLRLRRGVGILAQILLGHSTHGWTPPGNSSETTWTELGIHLGDDMCAAGPG